MVRKYASANFKIAGALTYAETTDSNLGAPPDGKLKYTQAGLYVQHLPSGWFGTAGWGHLTEQGGLVDNPATDTWYMKSGVRLKLNPLGATISYGEYLGANNSAMIVSDGGSPGDASDDTSQVIKGSSTRFWGFGAVQEIDAAAMSVWLRYRNHEVDVPGVNTKDMSTIVFGSIDKFLASSSTASSFDLARAFKASGFFVSA